MTKEEIKSRMKHLARKFCRRNRVYEEFDGSVGKLIEKSYLSAYLLCLHENKNKITELEKDNAELKEAVKHFNPCGEWDDTAHDCEFRHYAMEYGSKLTKAKEIITDLVKFNGNYEDDEEYQRKIELYDEIWEEAEKFLKEISE